MRYSNIEKFDLYNCYIRHNRNTTQAIEAYGNLYPERHQPDRTIFLTLERNLREHGSFSISRPKYGQRIDHIAAENIENVIAANPRISIRQISSNINITKSTVHRYLQKNKYHPYKPVLVQQLKPTDYDRRLEFCHWFNNKCDEVENFALDVCWTDETRFTNNGVFNRHNEHYWAVDNPHNVRQARFQDKFGFNVWCGLLGSRLIGPVIYDFNLNGALYLNLLQNQVSNYLDEIPLAHIQRMWFQQDGAPAHNSAVVREYLQNHFAPQLIATHGPTRWPARSPDLTPLDFFLWGYIKNEVYTEVFEDVNDLRERVLEVFHSLNRLHLRKAAFHVGNRTELCIANNGAHFEHLL